MEDEMNFEQFEFNFVKMELTAIVNGLSDQIRKNRKRIKKSKNSEKNNYLTNINSMLGANCRHYLLALAFLKGKKYLDIEKICLVKPNILIIFDIFEKYNCLKLIFTNRLDYRSSEGSSFKEKLENTISTWLKGE